MAGLKWDADAQRKIFFSSITKNIFWYWMNGNTFTFRKASIFDVRRKEIIFSIRKENISALRNEK